MTEIIVIDGKNYAAQLNWLSITTERQVEGDIRHNSATGAVIRRYKKIMQAGLFTGFGFNGLTVAAEVIANQLNPTASVIFVTGAKTQSGKSIYYGVAVIAGKILADCDLIFDSLDSASNWVKKISSLYVFEIYAPSDIAELLPNYLIKPEMDLWRKGIRSAKLKISQKDRQSSNQDNKTPIIVAGIIILLIALSVGGYFYYQSKKSKVIELTPEQKKAIVLELKNKEDLLLKSALEGRNFEYIYHAIDNIISYPVQSLGWSVDAVTLDIGTGIALFQWRMKSHGYADQLLAIRPNAFLLYDGTIENAGKLATESIKISIEDVNNYVTSIDELKPMTSIEKFLINESQKHGFAFKKGASEPIIKDKPPANSGVFFKPQYSKTGIQFNGSGFKDLKITLSSLRLAKSVKPQKIVFALNDGKYSTWQIDCSVYTK